MAKINIEFDTSTKKLDVVMDGKSIANVHSVNLSKGYYYDEDEGEKFGFSLMTLDSSKQEDEGYREMTQIVAKESKGATEAVVAGAITHPDHHNLLLLKKVSAGITKTISSFLKSRRGC